MINGLGRWTESLARAVFMLTLSSPLIINHQSVLNVHLQSPVSSVSERQLHRAPLPSNTTLKHILQRYLHDAPIRGAQNLAERGAVEVVIGTGDCRYDSLEGRGTVIRMVRYVEGFGP